MNKLERVALRQEAVTLRKQGFTYNYIEKKLAIPRSTVDFWLNGLKLSPPALLKIKKCKEISLKNARIKAVSWHNEQKRKRIEVAKQSAHIALSQLNKERLPILKLALAMLYLGEGFKSIPDTGLGNSDPLILKFFITSLRRLYGLTEKDFRCQLNLRMDQNAEKMKKYWAKELRLPLSAFPHVFYDKRSKGTTYDSYKGVCQVRCGNVAIQRELLWISKLYCDSMLDARA